MAFRVRPMASTQGGGKRISSPKTFVNFNCSVGDGVAKKTLKKTQGSGAKGKEENIVNSTRLRTNAIRDDISGER